MIPKVTDSLSIDGDPIAMTKSPGRNLLDTPIGATGYCSLVSSILTTAISDWLVFKEVIYILTG